MVKKLQKQFQKYWPHLSKKKQNLLLKRFIRKDTARAAAIEAGVNRNTANLHFNYFREQIYESERRAPRFEGEVEIDVKQYGKGIKRRTYDKKVRENPNSYEIKKPRTEKKPKKVLGILRRGGDIYTHVIEKENRETLLPIIHLVVESGTIIFSDEAKVFKSLGKEEYIHKTVNKTRGFVNPQGIHVGGVESFFSYSQSLLSRFKGIARHKFTLYLKECEWRWNHRDEKEMLRILKKLIL